MIRRSISLLIALLLALAGASPSQAGDSIKARLSSANASEEVSGTLTLDGYNLAGHLTGGGIDVAVTGSVTNNRVSVFVTGRIMPLCNLNNQSMSNDASNQGSVTSITIDFNCTTKAGGVGQDYLFQLDLELPSHHLQIPSDSNPGGSA